MDAKAQSQVLLQRPGSPSLLRKFAEVGFISAEVCPVHRSACGPGSPPASAQSSVVAAWAPAWAQPSALTPPPDGVTVVLHVPTSAP